MKHIKYWMEIMRINQVILILYQLLDIDSRNWWWYFGANQIGLRTIVQSLHKWQICLIIKNQI